MHDKNDRVINGLVDQYNRFFCEAVSAEYSLAAVAVQENLITLSHLYKLPKGSSPHDIHLTLLRLGFTGPDLKGFTRKLLPMERDALRVSLTASRLETSLNRYRPLPADVWLNAQCIFLVNEDVEDALDVDGELSMAVIARHARERVEEVSAEVSEVLTALNSHLFF